MSPEPADKETLTYVAHIREWTRRARELDEEGWDIRSNIDEPDLAPGMYRLASLRRRSPRARRATKLRYQIMDRDQFTCQDCGAKRGSGVRLQVHHVVLIAAGGKDVPENLLTLCEADHAGRHALLGGQSVQDELLNPDDEPAVKGVPPDR